jgi:hypothetical protein
MDMSDVVSTDAGYREAAGTTPLRHAQFDDPVSAAEEAAFCKACARFGFGPVPVNFPESWIQERGRTYPRECKIAPTTELNNRANFPFIVFFL